MRPIYDKEILKLLFGGTVGSSMFVFGGPVSSEGRQFSSVDVSPGGNSLNTINGTQVAMSWQNNRMSDNVEDRRFNSPVTTGIGSNGTIYYDDNGSWGINSSGGPAGNRNYYNETY